MQEGRWTQRGHRREICETHAHSCACVQVFGSTHSETFQRASDIANVHLLAGCSSDALKLLVGMAKHYTDALGEVTSSDDSGLHVLPFGCNFYQYATDMNWARGLQFHPMLATVYNNIGNVLRQQERLQEAVDMYEKARAIFEHSYGLNHLAYVYLLSRVHVSGMRFPL